MLAMLAMTPREVQIHMERLIFQSARKDEVSTGTRAHVAGLTEDATQDRGDLHRQLSSSLIQNKEMKKL